MSTIRVAEARHPVVVFGEEDGRVRVLGGISVKHLIHGAQQAFRIVQSGRTLAAQIGLQIRHQKSGSDSFPGNIADNQPEPVFPQSQEIVIIAATLRAWMQIPAYSSVFSGGSVWGKSLACTSFAISSS